MLVIDKFRIWVKSHPNNIAVVSPEQGRKISYRELEERSNQLSRYLLKQYPAGSAMRIGACLDQSIEMIIVLLAVWKAGHIVVPLSPGISVEALQCIISDTKTSFVLTNEHCKGLLDKVDAMGVSFGVLEAVSFEQYSSDVPEVVVPEDAGAYIVTSSGTSGSKPKSILGSHYQLALNANLWNGALAGQDAAGNINEGSQIFVMGWS